MLTFYYHPLSPIARRVWIALLEKGIPFEPVIVNLNGEQFQPEFLSLNPFHHVPVLVDGELRILESLAILDYLEAKYPSRSLLPQTPEAIAQMRMVQMVTTNELTPKLPGLAIASDSSEPNAATVEQIATVLNFLTQQLGELAYFGGNDLSLADITAGTAFPLLTRLGIELQGHPAIAAWYKRITARPSWQQTELDDNDFNTWKRFVSLMIKRRQRQTART
ncbi:MAG: glutathione S-transferase family protein [Coleofasciculus sp. C1-SOL-03]|jgi:glutathione S-transferase|uniref:glutathione S-transferase family protein n=1 Tax=Coleofasciculus sp. C1-SOL-03 TaxID=3069522 RepID=UPI003304B445